MSPCTTGQEGQGWERPGRIKKIFPMMIGKFYGRNTFLHSSIFTPRYNHHQQSPGHTVEITELLCKISKQGINFQKLISNFQHNEWEDCGAVTAFC